MCLNACCRQTHLCQHSCLDTNEAKLLRQALHSARKLFLVRYEITAVTVYTLITNVFKIFSYLPPLKDKTHHTRFSTSLSSGLCIVIQTSFSWPIIFLLFLFLFRPPSFLVSPLALRIAVNNLWVYLRSCMFRHSFFSTSAYPISVSFTVFASTLSTIPR